MSRRRGRSRKTGQPRLRLEALEPRLLLDGNVTATFANGVLNVVGDLEGNGVRIVRVGDEVRVEGLDASTTVNGQTSAAVFDASRAVSVVADMGDGSDDVEVSDLAGDRSVQITLGGGDNTASIANSAVLSDVVVVGSQTDAAGSDTVTVDHSNIGGDFAIGRGVGALLIDVASSDATNLIGGDVVIVTGACAANLSLRGYFIGSNLAWQSEAGDSTIALVDTQVTGDLLANPIGGTNSVDFQDVTVGGRFNLHMIGDSNAANVSGCHARTLLLAAEATAANDFDLTDCWSDRNFGIELSAFDGAPAVLNSLDVNYNPAEPTDTFGGTLDVLIRGDQTMMTLGGLHGAGDGTIDVLATQNTLDFDSLGFGGHLDVAVCGPTTLAELAGVDVERNFTWEGEGAQEFKVETTNVGGHFFYKQNVPAPGGPGSVDFMWDGGTIGSNAKFDLRDGTTGSATMQDVNVGKSLSYWGGSGDGLLSLNGSTVTSKLDVRMGGTQGVFDATSTAVGGNVAYQSYSAGDFVTLDDVDFQGNATFTLGNGNNAVNFTETDIQRNLKITGGGGDDTVDVHGLNGGGSATIGLGEGNNTAGVDTAVIDGNLKLTGESGNDTLTVNSTTVNGKTQVSTGDGDSTTVFDGADFLGVMDFKMGTGDDTLNCNDTLVSGKARINLGSGNDAVMFQPVANPNAIFGGNIDVLFGRTPPVSPDPQASIVIMGADVHGSVNIGAPFFGPSSVVLDPTAITGDLKIAGGPADDSVVLNDVDVDRSVKIDLGEGDNSVAMATIENPTFVIGRDLQIKGRDGADIVTVINGDITGKGLIDGGGGDNSVTLSPADIGRDLLIKGRDGVDTVVGSSLDVGGKVKLLLGDGVNTTIFTTSTVGRDLTCKTLGGDDQVTFTSIAVGGKAKLDFGGGFNNAGFTSAEFDSHLSLKGLHDMNAFTLTDCEVAGNFGVTTGNDLDVLTVALLDVGGRTTVKTTGAMDQVNVDSSTFVGPVRIDTGTDSDQVNIEAEDTPGLTSEFHDRLEVRTGTGDDTVTIGEDGEANNGVLTHDLVRLDGAHGDDLLDAGILGGLFNGNVFDVPPLYQNFEVVT